MSVSKKIKPYLNIGILLLTITALAFILRSWHFTTNPPSLYVDEVSHGYNAYSILKTGRDEYGSFMPFFFRSFNVYNPPLAVYTLVPSIAVFGLNEFGVRLPAVLLGTLFVPLTYLLVRELLKNGKLALLSAFFIAISPWHIHFSRFYHEANMTVFFSTLGLTTFLIARQKPRLLIVSALFYALAINYAHIGKIFVPLLLLGSLIFLQKGLFSRNKYLLLFLIILALAFIPTALSVSKAFARGGSVNILTNDVGDKKDKFIDGYLSHFSLRFLFNRGDFQGRHSVPGMGELYVFELPLIIFGLYSLLKARDKNYKFLVFWLLIAPIPAALATPSPHAGRDLVVMPVWSIISALGFLYLLKNVRWFMLTPLILIGFYNFLTYLHLYHIHYPKEKAVDWADGYKQMVQYVGTKYNDYDRIAITRYWGLPYIYVLFYLQFDPTEYQSQSENKNAFDKFEFYLGAPEPSNKKTLFVSTAEHKDKILKEIKLNNGDLFFTVHE